MRPPSSNAACSLKPHSDIAISVSPLALSPRGKVRERQSCKRPNKKGTPRIVFDSSCLAAMRVADWRLAPTNGVRWPVSSNTLHQGGLPSGRLKGEEQEGLGIVHIFPALATSRMARMAMPPLEDANCDKWTSGPGRPAPYIDVREPNTKAPPRRACDAPLDSTTNSSPSELRLAHGCAGGQSRRQPTLVTSPRAWTATRAECRNATVSNTPEGETRITAKMGKATIGADCPPAIGRCHLGAERKRCASSVQSAL